MGILSILVDYHNWVARLGLLWGILWNIPTIILITHGITKLSTLDSSFPINQNTLRIYVIVNKIFVGSTGVRLHPGRVTQAVDIRRSLHKNAMPGLEPITFWSHCEPRCPPSHYLLVIFCNYRYTKVNILSQHIHLDTARTLLNNV